MRPQFDLDASPIAGTLWISAFPQPGRYPFDSIVLCARELQPATENYPGVEILRCRLRDDGSPPTFDELHSAVKVAARVRRRLDAGKTVVCSCHMGRNRSALVAAISMMLRPSFDVPWESGLATPGCMLAEDVIKLIRVRRMPTCLSNQFFVQFLFDGQRACRSQSHPAWQVVAGAQVA